jgi:hypothetical protein
MIEVAPGQLAYPRRAAHRSRDVQLVLGKLPVIPGRHALPCLRHN